MTVPIAASSLCQVRFNGVYPGITGHPDSICLMSSALFTFYASAKWPQLGWGFDRITEPEYVFGSVALCKIYGSLIHGK